MHSLPRTQDVLLDAIPYAREFGAGAVIGYITAVIGRGHNDAHAALSSRAPETGTDVCVVSRVILWAAIHKWAEGFYL